MNLIEYISQPWPWYVGGALIGLMVPALLILANRQFGVSSSLQHFCAAAFPGKIAYFRYDWRTDGLWNMVFVTGIIIGGFIAATWLHGDDPVSLSAQTRVVLAQYGITDFSTILPRQIFNWSSLLTIKGFVVMVIGGFLVGFGTRYANGCTSGHSIMGMANLQVSALIATISFFAGGLVMTYFILPAILNL